MADIIAKHNYPFIGTGGKLLRIRIPQANVQYGLLYNWWAASAGSFITGWHLPSDTEYETLVSYLGGQAVAGGKLKETGTVYWNSPNTGATNEVGFNGRGADERQLVFGTVKNRTYFRTTSSSAGWRLYNASTDFIRYTTDPHYGHSIRLICDSSIDPGTVIIDGLSYNTVKIGNQVWMSENLRAIHYSDGTLIPEVTDQAAWNALTTGGLCAMKNDWNYV